MIKNQFDKDLLAILNICNIPDFDEGKPCLGADDILEIAEAAQRTLTKINGLIYALELIKSKSEEWQASDGPPEELGEHPYWNLGDIATGALARYEKDSNKAADNV